MLATVLSDQMPDNLNKAHIEIYYYANIALGIACIFVYFAIRQPKSYVPAWKRKAMEAREAEASTELETKEEVSADPLCTSTSRFTCPRTHKQKAVLSLYVAR